MYFTLRNAYCNFFPLRKDLFSICSLAFSSFAYSGGQSTQIKYLSKSTDTYNKILLQ